MPVWVHPVINTIRVAAMTAIISMIVVVTVSNIKVAAIHAVMTAVALLAYIIAISGI